MNIRAIFALSLLILGLIASVRECRADEKKDYDLRAAAGAGQLETVKKLISDGANVNSRSNRGYTALITGARGNYTDVVLYLIDADADVNAKDDDGDSALMFAITYHNMEVLQKLLRRGVDVNITNNSGATPLMKAVTQGHTDIVRMLLSKSLNLTININAVDVNYFTALMLAAKDGRVEMVEMLLRAGADPSKRSSYGETALSLATAAGHAAVVNLLSPKGAQQAADASAQSAPTPTAAVAVPPAPLEPKPAAGSGIRAITEGWFIEAEEDLAVADILLERGKYKAACFHYQQSVDRALRALILERGERLKKNHEIIDMISRVQRLEWSVVLSTEDAVFLNDVTKDRYPTEEGPALKENPSKADAQRASIVAKRFIDSVKVVLGRK